MIPIMIGKAWRFEARREVRGEVGTAEALRDVYGAMETNPVTQWGPMTMGSRLPRIRILV